MCISVRLSLNFHPVLKGEHQPPTVVGRGPLHYRQPESVVKLRDASLSLMYSEHEPVDDVGPGLPLLFLLLEGIQLSVNGGAVGEVVLHDVTVLQQSVIAIQ